MKLIMISLSLFPLMAFANLTLPLPQPGEKICYSRTYSKEHLRKNKEQKIKQVKINLSKYTEFPDQTYSSIVVKDLKGRNFSNGGAIDGEITNTAQARMDCDGGGYKIIQDPFNSDKIKIEIDFLSLDSENECEGPFIIDSNSVDKIMVLYRDHDCA